MATDIDVLIIDAGMAGIGMAVQLVRKFGTRKFEIVEKTSEIGGTWFLNTYPGCGCDVGTVALLLIFLCAKSQLVATFALQPEIHQYFVSVANQYDIRPHVRFNSAVKSAEYEPEKATWKVIVEDQRTHRQLQKRCKILISAVGALSIPKSCDIPGADSFKGRLFHSAQWDHSFDYRNKDVVCVGNGCSATQFMPVMATGAGKVKITQFSRQAHWLSERPNPEYSSKFQFLLRWVPGIQRIYRAYLYAVQEKDFAGFKNETGQRLREDWTAITTDYIKRNAPKKCQDFLVPDTVIGCKRRVMDTDYLACLHRDNVQLIHDDPIDHIAENGVVTRSGRTIRADAINGQNIADHWQWMEFGNGSPEAYLGTCLSGFPNFFIMMGPNTLSGHLTVMYTTEYQIGFVLRVIRPILEGLSRPFLARFMGYEYPESAAVTTVAERKDVDMVDRKTENLVWASGCTSWFIDEKIGRNTIMFPDYQFKFWLRSVFVRWQDLVYRKSEKGAHYRSALTATLPAIRIALVSVAFGALIGSQFLGQFDLSTLKGLQQYLS